MADRILAGMYHLLRIPSQLCQLSLASLWVAESSNSHNLLGVKAGMSALAGGR